MVQNEHKSAGSFKDVMNCLERQMWAICLIELLAGYSLSLAHLT